MSLRLLAVLLAAVLWTGCGRWPGRDEVAQGPAIRATVVTIRTTFPPGDEVVQHEVVIAGNRVRSTAERDVWRLFDVKEETVTFVDDVAGTVRTATLEAILRDRTRTLSGEIAPYYPRPSLSRSGETRTLHGTTAERAVIESGGYRRELWFGRHRAIPPRLFVMMHASEAPASPLAPMMRDADRELLAVEGFPLLDRTEITAGGETRAIVRAVVRIEQRDVPLDVVTRPRRYVDVTPRPANAKR